MQWDFWALSPVALHQVTWLFGDRGIPATLRHMDGFGSHTYSLWNVKGERYWVKWHFKTQQGIKNLAVEDAARVAGENADYHRHDLFAAIERGDYPRWSVKVQLMAERDADSYGINPVALDVNKPRCPVHHYHRDGQTRFDGNGGASPVYQPNSFGGPADDAS